MVRVAILDEWNTMAKTAQSHTRTLLVGVDMLVGCTKTSDSGSGLLNLYSLIFFSQSTYTRVALLRKVIQENDIRRDLAEEGPPRVRDLHHW